MIAPGTLVELLHDEVIPKRHKRGSNVYLVVEVEDGLSAVRGRKAMLLAPDGKLVWESFYDLIPL